MENHSEMSCCSTQHSAWFKALMIVGVLGVGAYAWMEHRQHLWAAGPYLFLLACPLMHLFMGHGKNHHGSK